ncbi:MAG: uracil-DNA glycosylase [Patescibacteria group bacterium]|nr:uracil-DNA glycosylase [Patescibacteria group bacterium]
MSRILRQVRKQIQRCDKCRLARTRTNTVPGEGPKDAEVAFVGEAPGYNEDREGRPFVGKAGKLLDKLLRSVQISRKDVWIGNVIKCRPPNNRSPHVDELRACEPYLDLQLREISPKVVCTLGRYATEHFLGDIKISEVHGTPFNAGRFVVFPLFHPAAALRSKNVKRELQEDFRKITDLLNGDLKAEEVKNQDENQISLF